MGLFSFLFGGKAKKQETKSNALITEQAQESVNSQTQENAVRDPWAPAVDALKSFLPTIASTIAGVPMVGGVEQQGIDAITKLVGGGGLDAAIAENNKTLSGEYLDVDSNPYLKDIATRVSGIAGSNANATFGGRGRTSGGLAAYYNGKAVGDSLTDLYGGAYEAERGRMSSAVGMAPSLQSAQLAPATVLAEYGANINNRPIERLSTQGGLLSQIANLGGTATGTTNTSGTTTSNSTRNVDTNETIYGRKNGLIGDIFNSLVNKAFGTTRSTGG